MIKTDAEFLQYALNHYDNPQLVFIEEFEADLKRFTYVNMLITKYKTSGEISHRLIINHIIILENCFTLPSLLKMLDYKIIPENKDTLETFLYFMERVSKCDNGLDFKLLNILNEE